jgi:hypothetical protein|tara:strand:- start:141 stop:398 length:258 start_codon:yes stop_codon:yes gene_type:complete
MLTYQNLKGTWTKEGNEFKSPVHKEFSILLVERKNCKSHQPPTYILGILPTGQREYISGIRNNKIDFQGKYFEIQIQDARTIVIR